MYISYCVSIANEFPFYLPSPVSEHSYHEISFVIPTICADGNFLFLLYVFPLSGWRMAFYHTKENSSLSSWVLRFLFTFSKVSLFERFHQYPITVGAPFTPLFVHLRTSTWERSRFQFLFWQTSSKPDYQRKSSIVSTHFRMIWSLGSHFCWIDIIQRCDKMAS